MRPISYLTLFVCALVFVPYAAAQQPAAKPERMPDTQVQFAGDRASGMDGMKGSATGSPAATLDESLEELHRAMRAYLGALGNYIGVPKPELPRPTADERRKRFGVDPFKFTFKPEFGNTVAGTFHNPTYALNQTEFKPAFTAVYELSLRDALKDEPIMDRHPKLQRVLRFLTFGATAGTKAPGFKIVDGFSIDQLRPVFSVYAKIEVPLSDLWGSNRKKAEADKTAGEDLRNKQLELMQQLDQAIQQIWAALRPKQSEIAPAR